MPTETEGWIDVDFYHFQISAVLALAQTTIQNFWSTKGYCIETLEAIHNIVLDTITDEVSTNEGTFWKGVLVASHN